MDMMMMRRDIRRGAEGNIYTDADACPSDARSDHVHHCHSPLIFTL